MRNCPLPRGRLFVFACESPARASQNTEVMMFANTEGASERLRALYQFYRRVPFRAARFCKKYIEHQCFKNVMESLVHEHVVSARASQNKEKMLFANAEGARREILGILLQFYVRTPFRTAGFGRKAQASNIRKCSKVAHLGTRGCCLHLPE